MLKRLPERTDIPSLKTPSRIRNHTAIGSFPNLKLRKCINVGAGWRRVPDTGNEGSLQFAKIWFSMLVELLKLREKGFDEAERSYEYTKFRAPAVVSLFGSRSTPVVRRANRRTKEYENDR